MSTRLGPEDCSSFLSDGSGGSALLILERFYRVHLRGPGGRHSAEQDAYDQGSAKGDQD